MRMRKRMTGLLLVLVMLLGMIPVSANAEDGLAQGLYLTMSDGGVLADYKEMTQNGQGVWGYFGVDYEATQEKTVYYYRPGCTEFSVGENDAISVSVTEYDDVYAITLAAGCSGRISTDLHIKGNDYAMNFPFVFDDGSGDGGDDGSMCGQKISESHKTTAADIYPGEVPQRGGDSTAVAFPYDGKTYYMGVTMHGFFYPSSGGSMGPILDRGSYEEHAYDIGFYVSEGAEGFDRIEDQNLIYKLTNAFDSLEVKVWALPDHVMGCETPDVVPAIYESTVNESCAECTVLELGVENRGDYLITATGVIGNKTYETYTFLYWDCREAIRFEYDEKKPEKDWIVQINAFLDNLVQEGEDGELDTCAAIVDLPAGEYEGYIIVPNDLGRMHVNIYGSFGNERTILHGGILSNAQFATHVEEIDFVGNGRNNKFAKDETTSNYALTGLRYVKARRCSFTGYDIALDGRGVHKSAINCTFENNGTAILFGEGREVAYDPTYSGNTFRGNGIALDFQFVPAEHPMTFFDFESNCFIDNEVDIWNRLGRRIFIPGCYFAETKENREVVRECVYRPIGNQQGEGGGNLKKQVLYYPQAESPAFREGEYIFDTNFYGGKSPIVSVNFTKTFLIPAGALDGATFTVMRHDQLLARITFAPAAATFSLRRSRSMDVFDATVELMRSEDGKSKSITLQEIPGGRTPTISVPCDSAWKSVEVKDEEGNALEAVIEDGFIQFVVAHGGNYTITNTTVAETPKEETPTVKPSTKPSGGSSSGSSSAGSTTTVEKNPDGSTTTTQVNKVTGTVTETTKNKDGSTETVKTEKDGTVTTNVKAADGTKSETVVDKSGVQSSEVTVSNKAVKEAADAGEAVTLPIPEVKATTSSTKAATVTVELPANVKTAEVEVPVANVNAGTVAVIVHADGTEEVVRNCVPTEDGIALNVANGATVKIVDNSRDFADVSAAHSFSDAVDFASARGIVEGYSNGSFGVGGYATSVATATVIARIMGEDFYGSGSTTKAQNWAKENGIAAGLDLSGNVNRVDFMTMLWRAAGSPAANTTLSFTDASSIAAGAMDAMAWAVEVGLIGGYSDGSVRPNANITRGAMAAIAQRYMTRK